MDGHTRPLSALKNHNVNIVVDQASLDKGVVHGFTNQRDADTYAARVVKAQTGVRAATDSLASFRLYENANFGGRQIYFSGPGTSRNLTDFPMCFLCGSWNDQATSVSTRNNTITLYEHTQRLGRTLTVTQWTYLNDLGAYNFNDTASSYLISG